MNLKTKMRSGEDKERVNRILGKNTQNIVQNIKIPITNGFRAAEETFEVENWSEQLETFHQ